MVQVIVFSRTLTQDHLFLNGVLYVPSSLAPTDVARLIRLYRPGHGEVTSLPVRQPAATVAAQAR